MFYRTLFLIFLGINFSCHASKKVGILQPAQHVALNEVTRGIQDVLNHKGYTLKVQNAQGDMGMQRAIIQQFIAQGVDVIVPIGTQAMQMAISMTNTTPVVGVSVQPSPLTYDNTRPENVTGTHDEIPVNKTFAMIERALPNVKKIALVYSANEKIMPEVKIALDTSKKYGIEIVPKMIQQLSELYSVGQTLPSDVDAIFILKDHMVVSGVETLVMEAQKRHILLISSDEGTVAKGAMLALGSTEYDSGKLGGDIVEKVLEGTDIKDVPFVRLSDLSIFYNLKTCPQAVQEKLRTFARSSGYTIQPIESA